MCLKAAKTPFWDQAPGHNILDSGSPNYEVYETKDGQYMAVGSLEPQFYALLLKGLDLSENDSIPSVYDRQQWPALKSIFASKFKSKTREEWTRIFEGVDACVTPILKFDEIDSKHISKHGNGPQPSPILSRTPATASSSYPSTNGCNTVEVLTSLGVPETEIQRIIASSASKL
jgi:alpha-methylacyl-CoA racemase